MVTAIFPILISLIFTDIHYLFVYLFIYLLFIYFFTFTGSEPGGPHFSEVYTGTGLYNTGSIYFCFHMVLGTKRSLWDRVGQGYISHY